MPALELPLHVRTHLLGKLSNTLGEVPRAVVCSDTASCAQALAPVIIAESVQPGEIWIIVTAHENAIADMTMDGTLVTVSLRGRPCPDGVGHILYATSSIYRVKARDVRVQRNALPPPNCGAEGGPDAPRNKPARASRAPNVPVRFHALYEPCSAGGMQVPTLSGPLGSPPSTTSRPAQVVDPVPKQATFGIHDVTGARIKTVKTDVNGHATAWLPPGSYCMDATCASGNSLSGFSLDEAGIVSSKQAAGWIHVQDSVIELRFFGQCPG